MTCVWPMDLFFSTHSKPRAHTWSGTHMEVCQDKSMIQLWEPQCLFLAFQNLKILEAMCLRQSGLCGCPLQAQQASPVFPTNTTKFERERDCGEPFSPVFSHSRSNTDVEGKGLVQGPDSRPRPKASVVLRAFRTPPGGINIIQRLPPCGSQGSISISERGPVKSHGAVAAQLSPSFLVFLNLRHILLQSKGLMYGATRVVRVGGWTGVAEDASDTRLRRGLSDTTQLRAGVCRRDRRANGRSARAPGL